MCDTKIQDTKEIQGQFQLINTLIEYFHSGLVLNTVIDKLHFLLKLVKNRLNEVWQHAAHCPYLVDNLKHGHWNFNGKYLKSVNFSYCSLNVDSVLGYCLSLLHHPHWMEYRSLRKRVTSQTVTSQTSFVTSQTHPSRFANVFELFLKRLI